MYARNSRDGWRPRHLIDLWSRLTSQRVLGEYGRPRAQASDTQLMPGILDEEEAEVENGKDADENKYVKRVEGKLRQHADS